MNRYAISLVAFAALVVVFGVALMRKSGVQEVKSALVGMPAPEFTLPDLLHPDATVTNASLKGRWYLINVWGQWCGECRREHPVLESIQREGKVAVLGVDYPDPQESDKVIEDERARQWLTELGNPYVAVAVDHEGRTLIDYGVYGAPENYLVNPQGIIVKKWFGLTAETWRAAEKEFIDGVKP